MKITPTTAMQKLQNISDNELFSVCFIKRSDGTEREMLARRGVSKFVKGGVQNVDPEEHNLLHVFDMGRYNKLRRAGESEADAGPDCYRSINLESILWLKINGVQYEINDFPMVRWQVTWGKGMARTVAARTDVEARTTFKRLEGLKSMPKGATICLV